MATQRAVRGSLLAALVWSVAMPGAFAQAPTYPTGPSAHPGSTASALGPTPGAGGSPFGFMPGAGEMILGGRPGPSFPRVPTSITTPGRGQAGATGPGRIAAPARLSINNPPIYGTLALPRGAEDEGPPGGLTLDEAIERLVRANLDLRAKSFEIPQAQADILTAGLRANPILYADGQLVPYGQYGRDRPGGPTQYDLNVSQPFDLSGKRPARSVVATRALRVLEAQYQDAVRVQIDNLYTAFVDVLAARETIRFAGTSVRGLGRVREVTETLYRRADVTRPDVNRVRIQEEAAAIGVEEARAVLARAKRSLALLLNLPPDRAEVLELRGTIADDAPPPPSSAALVRLAIEARPDLAAQRLGIARALADVRLARANRFADVYVLYQPYTFQDNAPFGLKSPTSWALGVTAPLPITDRNQGVIRRAGLNVTQTQVELAMLERRVADEVTRASREYDVSRAAVRHYEAEVLPAARQMLDDALRLFTGGEQDALAYFNTQRYYNETVRNYRDALVRHRRSMLRLNTSVARRVLP